VDGLIQVNMNKPLYVGTPNVGDREALLARINDMLDRRWLSNNGPLGEVFGKAEPEPKAETGPSQMLKAEIVDSGLKIADGGFKNAQGENGSL
jgi:hypothetical protein